MRYIFFLVITNSTAEGVQTSNTCMMHGSYTYTFLYVNYSQNEIKQLFLSSHRFRLFQFIAVFLTDQKTNIKNKGQGTEQN
ncbi:hypothetical protein EDC96DRAFT_503588 [Choanephora cucurbitarum]|nr:hypothetical protein EDC96DRAFT_503588 [Choanephora cucurbitarum]